GGRVGGAVVGVACTGWVAVEGVAGGSVAVQVRVRAEAWGRVGGPGVVTSAKVRGGLGSQASVAVGVVNDGDAGHWIVLGPGSVEITGAVVSTTWMTWLLVDLLPRRTVDVQGRVTFVACGQLGGHGVVTPAIVSGGLGS